MDYEGVRARGFNWDWAIPPPATLECIGQIICWLRLTLIEDPTDGFSDIDYACNNILWFDALSEDWPAEELVGWKGEDLFNVLATRLDAPPESGEFQKAQKVVWTLLANSRMEKVTHAGGLLKTPALGALWELPENVNKDREPGTFAELLRYGSVHFEQTKRVVKEVKIQRPAGELIMKKGIPEL